MRYYPDLKVTHRILKGGEDIVFVGFPLTSLDYTQVDTFSYAPKVCTPDGKCY